MQWDYVKSLRSRSRVLHNGSTLSQNSASSLNSLKSGSSMKRVTEENEQIFPKVVRSEEQVQVVISPKNPEIVIREDDEVNRDLENLLSDLNIGNEDSKRSIQTTRKVKKGKNRKRSLSRGYNDDGDIKTPYSLGKTKKKKFRMKNSNSKSTVATRDTFFSDKRRKIRKQKSKVGFIFFNEEVERDKLLSGLTKLNNFFINATECEFIV